MTIQQPKQAIIDPSQDATLAQQLHIPLDTVDKTVYLKNTVPSIGYPLTLVKSTPDPRDYIFTTPPSPAKTSYSLKQYCSPIQDQGQLGSCTGFSITGAMETNYDKQGKFTKLSELFVYYNERNLENTVGTDSGASLRDGIQSSYKLGVSSEALWPYNVSQYKTKPSTAAYTDALRRKITSYQACTSLNAVISAIQNNMPVVFGFLVYQSFWSIGRNGIMPVPNTRREVFYGGHAVSAVGYDNSTSLLTIRNSWGTGWGDGGYFYMPYAVMSNPSLVFDMWAISSTPA
jgi:C1A family cysteine protease